MAKYEHIVYICYSLDFDDAYIGRTKDYERRQSEHWQLQDLLPLMIILDKVTLLVMTQPCVWGTS